MLLPNTCSTRDCGLRLGCWAHFWGDVFIDCTFVNNFAEVDVNCSRTSPFNSSPISPFPFLRLWLQLHAVRVQPDRDRWRGARGTSSAWWGEMERWWRCYLTSRVNFSVGVFHPGPWLTRTWFHSEDILVHMILSSFCLVYFADSDVYHPVMGRRGGEDREDGRLWWTLPRYRVPATLIECCWTISTFIPHCCEDLLYCYSMYYCVYEYVFICISFSYWIEHLPSQKALLLLSLDERRTFLIYICIIEYIF